MGQLRTDGDLFVEEVVIGAGTTYVTGGITVALTKCTSLSKVRSVQIKTASGATTAVIGAAVAGSEVAAPPTFKLQAFWTGAAVSSALAEITSASTVLENAVVSVVYEGSA